MKSFFTLAFAVLCSWIILPASAHAGYVELGGSGTYRRSNFDPSSYDQSFSLSASVSYLFSDSTALEASYTDGFSKRFVAAQLAGSGDHITTVHTQFAGLDFVFTFGDKDATFRPYLKAGVGYIFKKRLVDQITGYSNTNDIEDEHPGFVPSAGAGFKIALSQHLSMKVGFDAWNSDPLGYGDITHVDVAARAGLSWLL